MNSKIITLGLLIALSVYGINSVIAQTSDDNSNDGIPDCDDPLYDGSGYDNGNHIGNQRGDMDGSKTQSKTQLKDGSGSGGMYGNLSGECLIV